MHLGIQTASTGLLQVMDIIRHLTDSFLGPSAVSNTSIASVNDGVDLMSLGIPMPSRELHIWERESAGEIQYLAPVPVDTIPHRLVSASVIDANHFANTYAVGCPEETCFLSKPTGPTLTMKHSPTIIGGSDVYGYHATLKPPKHAQTYVTSVDVLCTYKGAHDDWTKICGATAGLNKMDPVVTSYSQKLTAVPTYWLPVTKGVEKIRDASRHSKSGDLSDAVEDIETLGRIAISDLVVEGVS
jgi:hypothetical protein